MNEDEPDSYSFNSTSSYKTSPEASEVSYLNETYIPAYDDEKVPFHYLAKKNKNLYPEETKNKIRAIYLISVIIWLILIYVCSFYRTDWVGYLILFIPILIFAISFSNIDHQTVELEKEMFGDGFLSFLLLVVTFLTNWNQTIEKGKILKALIISIVLIMGSLINVWVKINDLILVKHIRTIFQTTALTLLIYALYIQYRDQLANLVRTNKLKSKAAEGNDEPIEGEKKENENEVEKTEQKSILKTKIDYP